MSQNEDDTPTSRVTAKAALNNIRRMLKGEVDFPASPDATAEMIKSAVPVLPPQPRELSVRLRLILTHNLHRILTRSSIYLYV
ncbi:hypothetical protein ACL9RI_17675 [Janthinobacterium sp. Mn2066]|uniref:hypothetical protein n=1 Tax=Janthinobacterium sp. Mn2066 TaxID=3395264 RepID=UPI003BDEFF82